MTRRILVAILSIAIRVFFRRVEVKGRDLVPPNPRPAIFVLNHPNGLIDPLFILCRAPRRVSFLAKSTMFKMPVIGWITRGLESLPIYRQVDKGEDVSKNAETFARARELLARGGTIAIFPEGTTHSQPSLLPIKSGAARIALGARDKLDSLEIVPAGLYYSAKETFRSKALIRFGEPFPVERVALKEDGEPAREDVQALSARIDEALRAITLNADHAEALSLIARAERIFSSDPEAVLRRSLAGELALRRRFEEGFSYFREREPALLADLGRRIDRYEAELEAAGGLDPTTLRASYPTGAVIAFAAVNLVRLILALPPALVGAALHYPTYRLCGVLAARFSNQEDVMVATIKFLAALLLFPLTWAAAGTAVGLASGPRMGLLAVALAPATAYVAVRYGELLDRTVATARGFWLSLSRPRLLEKLVAERGAIREEILKLAEALPAAAPAPSGTLPS